MDGFLEVQSSANGLRLRNSGISTLSDFASQLPTPEVWKAVSHRLALSSLAGIAEPMLVGGCFCRAGTLTRIKPALRSLTPKDDNKHDDSAPSTMASATPASRATPPTPPPTHSLLPSRPSRRGTGCGGCARRPTRRSAISPRSPPRRCSAWPPRLSGRSPAAPSRRARAPT